VSASVPAGPTGPTPEELADRWRRLQDRVAARAAVPARIVAVTKGFPVEVVRRAVEAGIVDLGENYAQELVGKAEELGDGRDIRWHAIGRLQRNKVRRLAPFVHLWQAVDRPALGAEVARWAPGAQVLVQVDISGEATKGGCPPAEVARLVASLANMGLEVRGLMGIGPLGPPEAARRPFRQLVGLADEMGLPERSIGMTGDLDVALEEGATMVRVGRALFGARPT
jgi:PLP dependent protein